MPTAAPQTERVYVAATKASPATEEPVKRTATRATPAKRASAEPKAAAKAPAAPAKRATKAAAATASKTAAPAKAPAKRATKAAAKGFTVSDNETAEMVVTKYRQRPPGARVMFGFMAGKDILETRITFRGKEYLAGDYMANAWKGMDSLCESVAQSTLDHMLANTQPPSGVASVGDKPNTQ